MRWRFGRDGTWRLLICISAIGLGILSSALDWPLWELLLIIGASNAVWAVFVFGCFVEEPGA